MRSARTLLATATATAALVVGAPAAFAAHMGDWDHDKPSYSKEHEEDSGHDEDDYEKKPYGGVHTGGGALTAVGEDDGEYKDEKDDGEYKGEEDEGDYKKGDKGDEYKNDKDDEYKKKPHGGVHTGGGALAAVNGDDWSGKHDEGGYEDKEDEGDYEDEGDCRGEKSDEYKDEKGDCRGDKGDEYKNDKDDEYKKKPHGGVHTGGGALAAVNGDDWSGKHDEGGYKDEGGYNKDEGGYNKDEGGYKEDEGGYKEKPHGGVHAGGGGLADPGVSGSGLAALAALGAGAYALKRKKASGSVA